MTEPTKPNTEGAAEAANEAVGEIVEVIFSTNYVLVLAAFVAGALIIAGVVYLIGSREVASEEVTDATD